MRQDWYSPTTVGARIARVRGVAQAEGRALEVWEGDGRTPQGFTCNAHPGRSLSMRELRESPPNPRAWRYVVPNGTAAAEANRTKQRRLNGGAIAALDDALARALDRASGERRAA